MRNLRQITAATALTLALALSVSAGQIQCPGAPSPGDVPSTGAPGNIQSDGSPSPGEIPSLGIVLTILDLMF